MFDKRAMLVELTIRQWTARKHDKGVSQEVDQLHAARHGGRYNKQLIAKSALEAIAKEAGTIRSYHYSRTLPWGNNGQRLLPAKLFMEYRTEIAEHQREFNRLADVFVTEYPALVNDARQHLGTLFNSADYPGATQIRKAFGIELDFFPVPTSGDFRVDVASDERAQLQAQIEEATRTRQKAATQACYIRIKETLERMKNQCVPGKTRITTSLVDDVYDLAKILDVLNINDDPDLTRIGDEIRRDLLVSADNLRNSPSMRKQVGERASEILDSLAWS